MCAKNCKMPPLASDILHALSRTYGVWGGGGEMLGFYSFAVGSMHSARLDNDVHLNSRCVLAVQPPHVMRFSDKVISSKAMCSIQFYIIIYQTL
jgi:hypothetical protein